ncbi:MAG: GNAT family N-acetyltransferase [Hyphomicrobiales bacterium]|nr:GNAT family N-acetyltransferase [Hyphomicrobiales bacterium]MBV9429064.1 GNAT family N-acetyltransferase [Bradyrhizobiaceae bacterium]
MSASEPDPHSGRPVGVKVDATPARRPEAVVLEGRFGRVEKLDAARHGASLWQALKDDNATWAYLGYGPFADETAFAAWLAERPKLDDPYSYAIVAPDGGALGIAALMEIRPAMRVIEVGNILYAPALQRTRLATEAQYLLARYVFETLDNRRYEWKCNALNAPSRRAAERFGFTFEGLFRQHQIVKGRNRDTAWFSMLDSEWPARKAAFERWLAADNFDGAGRQKSSLAALNRGTLAGLRRANVGDVDAVVAFQRAAYAKNRPLLGVEPLPLLADYRKILADYEIWLYESDGLDGVLILEPRKDDLLIWSIATAPRLHGQGLGRRLLAAAEERARALGLGAMRLYTGEPLKNNIAWYEHHGYARERVEDLGDRRAVHMMKRLAT